MHLAALNMAALATSCKCNMQPCFALDTAGYRAFSRRETWRALLWLLQIYTITAPCKHAELRTCLLSNIGHNSRVATKKLQSNFVLSKFAPGLKFKPRLILSGLKRILPDTSQRDWDRATNLESGFSKNTCESIVYIYIHIVVICIKIMHI